MKVCVAGKNNIAIDCAKYLLDKKLVHRDNFLAMFNRDDSGNDHFQNSFKKFCTIENLNAISLEELFLKKLLNILELIPKIEEHQDRN